MADQERLPLTAFIHDCERFANQGLTVGEWLEWLYRHYCIGQHEVVALRKLRQNKYNTFKFYYQDQQFVWASNPENYSTPLRYPTLRLFNALTILEDLGLVSRHEDETRSLTDQGNTFLEKVTGGRNGN